MNRKKQDKEGYRKSIVYVLISMCIFAFKINQVEKHIFQLRPTDEYIELIKLLKLKQIAQTGGHAKMIVEEGLVFVNGVQEFRKRKKLRLGDLVEMEDIEIKITA